MGSIRRRFSQSVSSVTQSCPTLWDPVNHSTPSLPVHHQLLEFIQTHVHRAMMPSSHLILCCPLLLLPPIPPGIRVFSNESTLRMRWPKYWSFSFSISPSSEHPGLISFRMDWLDLLAVQGTLVIYFMYSGVYVSISISSLSLTLPENVTVAHFSSRLLHTYCVGWEVLSVQVVNE